MTLQEIRACEKEQIKVTIKDNTAHLIGYDNIISKCIEGRNYTGFSKLRSSSDFCDGIKMFKGHCNGVKDIQSFLKGHEIDVKLPHTTNSDDHFFI